MSTPDYLVLFGRNLRAARLQAGLTSDDVAARSGIKMNDVARVEAGVLDVRLSVMALLAEVVGRSLPDLLGDVGA